MGGRRLGPQEFEQMKTLHNKGKSHIQIARKLKRSRWFVSNCLKGTAAAVRTSGESGKATLRAVEEKLVMVQSIVDSNIPDIKKVMTIRALL